VIAPITCTAAQMLRAAFSFLLSLFKLHTHLHHEVRFLQKQMEIVARLSPRKVEVEVKVEVECDRRSRAGSRSGLSAWGDQDRDQGILNRQSLGLSLDLDLLFSRHSTRSLTSTSPPRRLHSRDRQLKTHRVKKAIMSARNARRTRS
jgi:hypothetical protein